MKTIEPPFIDPLPASYDEISDEIKRLRVCIEAMVLKWRTPDPHQTNVQTLQEINKIRDHIRSLQVARVAVPTDAIKTPCTLRGTFASHKLALSCLYRASATHMGVMRRLSPAITNRVPVQHHATIGIVCALPLEYQAVFRRLDVVHWFEPYSEAHNVLDSDDGNIRNPLAWGSDAAGPGYKLNQEMRFVADTPIEFSGDRSISGCLGSIAGTTVILVCLNGKWTEAGDHHLRAKFDELLGNHAGVSDWYLVGIAACLDKTLPVGTILYATEYRKLVDKSSKTVLVTETRRLKQSHRQEHFRANRLYVRVPTGLEAADPSNVAIVRAPFVSGSYVQNKDEDRERTLAAVKAHGWSERTGLEMEGHFVASIVGSENVSIVKGISDYGGDEKSSWSDELEAHIQEFAAELAAEATAQLIKASSPPTDADNEADTSKDTKDRK